MSEQLAALFSSYKGNRLELIQIMQDVQEMFGYLPEEALLQIAAFTRVPTSQVYGTASFYSQFRFSPRGRREVLICRGTACHVRGAPRILDEAEHVLGIKEGETTPDLEYTLETVACIGCCSLAPCLMLDGEVMADLTAQKVRDLFAKEAKT